MSKEWQYAQMSKAAAEAGGPAVWMNSMRMAEYARGASDTKAKITIPLLAVGAGIGAIATVVCQKIQNWRKQKNEKEQQLEKEGQMAECLLKNMLDAVEKTINETEETDNEKERRNRIY